MVISLKNISFSYLHKSIFRDVNFTFEASKCYIIQAENGAGKSTLFQLISGMIKKYEGEIWIKNMDISQLSIQSVSELVSLCLSTQPIGSLTVRELFEFSNISIENKMEELENWQLTSWFNTTLDSMSEGERQWIYIARAFILQRPIILLDEPTAFLDKEKRKLLYKKINETIRTKNSCILINTHDSFANELTSVEQIEIVDKVLQHF